MENNKALLIPKEKFEYAGLDGKIHGQRLEDKPIGYFKDAWLRFRRNKASIFAAIIIIAIILFSLLVPLFSFNYDSSFMDTYYAKNGPRISWLARYGAARGNVEEKVNHRRMYWLSAAAVGALHKNDNVSEWDSFTMADGLEGELSPVIRYKEGSGIKSNFTAEIDSYLELGFVYMEITQDEYKKIEAWQSETGIQVLYPLIAQNEYTYEPLNKTNANFWYKADKSKGSPVRLISDIDTDGNPTVTVQKIDIFSADEVFEDNYKRNSDGSVRYWDYVGGGDTDTAQYKIRVLYYNYYRYKNGFEPNYIFGTDSQGYDLALRLADGIRLSLFVSLLVSAINFAIGTIYGAAAGYYGGAVDLTMERITDILSGIPSIVVMTLFQLHFAQRVGVIPSLLFAFVLTGWIGMSSRVRTQFYRFKNQEYVMAARTLGARDRRIIWKHIFPNTLGTIITGSVLSIPGVIFSESMLSFLGIVNLGGTKTTSLGQLLSDASGIWTNYPHLMLFPAIVISLLMICFNLFGNGLRDAFNPSLRGVEE